jgi:hypothetical protein
MLKKPLHQPPYSTKTPSPYSLSIPFIKGTSPPPSSPIDSPSCLHTATDARFGGGEEKMMWHCGIHELGRKIGKLLEQVVF